MTDGNPFELCAFCADLCLDRCPVVASTGSVTLSPWGKMLHGWLLEKGRIEASEEVASLAYQCTGCLSCHEACAHDVDVETALFDLRARFVKAGIVPYEQELFEVPTDELVEAQRKLVPAKYFVPEAQAVLFAGCHILRGRPGMMKDLLATFRGLGVEFIGASDEAAVCCGYPLYAGGYLDAFARNAARVTAALQGYRMVVVASACCVHTMKNLYPQVGIDRELNVKSALDLVAPLVTRIEREPLGLALGYHDSCFLGRHQGQYDPPREVIDHVNGMPPLELRRNQSDSTCCGAAGGWDLTSPVQSGMASTAVLDMASDTGADYLVSACTTCSSHLSAEKHDVKVLDLFNLTARWLAPRRKR